MSLSSLPPPILIADEDGLRQLLGALASCPVVAVDTESNSLHAYRERVCLIQFSTPTADYIVDPIRLLDLSPLAPFFANPDQEKVFHAAEYDLTCLGRDYGFECVSIFDTMSAARSLGWPHVGLAAILDAHFGVTLNKKYQRADWKRRPLTPEQLDYARLDTHYLVALRDRQLQALTESGHWPEAREEFARLARSRGHSTDAGPDPAAFWRVTGARDLTPAQAGVLRALFAYREHEAERLDCPPFRVRGEATLLDLARRAPRGAEDLAGVPGMTPEQIRRHARGVLLAVEAGLLAPAQRPRQTDRESDEVRERYDRLHTWRKNRARARGVESDVILPRTTLLDLARQSPRTLDDLVDIVDFGPWRRDTYGEEILALVSSVASPPRRT
jgi:ribonuclease D